MKHNVSTVHNCFGCGVCVAACPLKIVHIGLNRDGFYEPSIVEADKCTECGMCLDVCSFYGQKLPMESMPIQSWAAWSNDMIVRHKCSSGGIGFELCRQMLDRGYRIVVCRYNAESGVAEHYIADNQESLMDSIGSKYIQSFTSEAFSQLERGKKYLIVGTPCQIDSLRRMILRRRMSENIVLVDFFCHCVPSMLAWKGYLTYVEKKIGKVTHASWRNKFEYGWHDSWIMSLDNCRCGNGKESFQSRMSQGDMFYRLFLGGLVVNPACHKDCVYKYDKSAADIRLGDMWGNTYASNEDGVSAVIAFTRKGKDIIASLEGIKTVEHPFDLVAEGQMRHNSPMKILQPVVLWMLRHNVGIDTVWVRGVLFIQRVFDKLKRVLT